MLNNIQIETTFIIRHQHFKNDVHGWQEIWTPQTYMPADWGEQQCLEKVRGEREQSKTPSAPNKAAGEETSTMIHLIYHTNTCLRNKYMALCFILWQLNISQSAHQWSLSNYLWLHLENEAQVLK